ncbi:fimbrial biogenesis outer membrane usher protein [Dyella choica]|uniref:Fimbrial biogenesis outer membrane usher protein n=2 Tax=Dyella choica TaxID=1927959 RepID=A0A432M971_9GAMM|nr:fimbrial biogenesis outer membrane usher protein [Dyella choica]
MAIAGLLVSARAWSAAAAAPVEVQFNEQFLHYPGNQQADLSRYERGNPALPGTYTVDTNVNELWQGRLTVRLAQVGADSANVQLCVNRDLLDRLGVDLTQLSEAAQASLVGSGSCASIDKLIPQANAVFDNGEQQLNVSVPQAMLRHHARGWVDPKFWDNGVTAATLQYNANTYRSHTNGSGYDSNTYVGLNAGLNVGAWRLRHSGSLTYGQSSGQAGSYHYQRNQTTLQRSLPSFKTQLLLGEGYTDGEVFDSVGYRGMRLASDDRMYPQSQRGYAPTMRGIANTNARVQVRQNGMVIYETTVAPGAFVIDDLYPTGYNGDLELVITEADGTVRSSKLPYAPAVKALRVGAMRYSVTLGHYRDPQIQNTPWLIETTLRRGVTNTITGYGGVTAAQGYQATQGGAALNTRYGAVGLDLTLARAQLPMHPAMSGKSVRLSYSRLLSSDTNITLATYRYSSASYLSLRDAMLLRNPVRNLWYDTGSLPDQWSIPRPGTPQLHGVNPLPYGRMRGQFQITLNQTLRAGAGSLYLSGSTQDYWDRRGRTTQFNAGYNNSWRDVTYGIALARQYDSTLGRWDNQAMLNVSVPLGSVHRRNPLRSTTQVQYGQRGGSNFNETLTGSAGVDNNFSYSTTVGRNTGNNASTTASTNFTYQAPLTTLTASAARGNGYNQFGAGMSGGIVAYRGGIAFTPSMGDTVAIVEAKGASGARVTSGSGLRVDRFGHAVVANLMPFQQNEIEIDPKGLPMNIQLQTTTQRAVPTDGAVVPVKFEVHGGGRAALVEAMLPDGQLLPFGAEVLDAEGQAVGVVAQAGRVMLRNLTADQGTYTIRWGDQPDQRCGLAVDLPSPKPGDKGWVRTAGTCRIEGPLVQTKSAPDMPSTEGEDSQNAPPEAQQTSPVRQTPAPMGANSPSASIQRVNARFDAIGALPMVTRDDVTHRPLRRTNLPTADAMAMPLAHRPQQGVRLW